MSALDQIVKIVETVFEPKLNAMREFTESVKLNKELSSLLASGVAVVKTRSEETVRKPRAAVRPKDDDVRCQALVWMLEKDADGNWVPQRCTRGCEDGSDFCKSHGAVDGKKCADCSAYHGEDICHGFKHEHLGTIHSKSYVIDKFWNDLVRYTERNMKVRSGEIVPSAKKTEKVVDVLEKKEKVRRVIDNPYMNWLAVHRGEIKAGLLADNPDLGKGREITVAVTKKAGEMWKSMSKEEQQSWKGKKGVDETDDVVQGEMPPAMEDDSVESQKSEEEEQQEDDGIKLVFNEEHNVWVDEETGLYYEKNNAEESPIGQMNNGKPCAFKKAAKKN